VTLTTLTFLAIAYLPELIDLIWSKLK